MKVLKERLAVLLNGLLTGLTLQLAIGPSFFYVMSLALKKGIWDGLVASLAVASVDCFYISLAIFGIGKILEKGKIKKLFGILNSVILIVLGILIIKEIPIIAPVAGVVTVNSGLFRSFTFVFVLTLFNPLTVVVYTSLFTVKATEHDYSVKQLCVFGFAVGLATLLFFSTAVSLVIMLKIAIPFVAFQIMNGIVGLLLIFYGSTRFYKTLKR